MKQRKFVIVSVAMASCLILFQNCADGGFLPMASNTARLSSTVEDIEPESDYELPTSGNKHYVSANGGNDSSGPCTSMAPCRTIRAAYLKAKPGDAVIVKAGVYSDETSFGVLLDSDGTASLPITVISEVPRGAIIDMKNKLDTFGVYIGGDYNILKGFKIRNGYRGGIELKGKFVKILENEISNNGNTVPLSSVYGQDGISGIGDGAIISRNYIHHNGRVGSAADHGLYLHGDDILISNNIITHNAHSGIQIAGDQTVSNMKIYNNTVAFNGAIGIVLWMKIENLEVTNNIIYKNGEYGYEAWAAHGTATLRNNLFFGNEQVESIVLKSTITIQEEDQDRLRGDPLFYNEANDYRLKTGSAAIDSGTTVSLPNDFSGQARPFGRGYDVGAHEKH